MATCPTLPHLLISFSKFCTDHKVLGYIPQEFYNVFFLPVQTFSLGEVATHCGRSRETLRIYAPLNNVQAEFVWDEFFTSWCAQPRHTHTHTRSSSIYCIQCLKVWKAQPLAIDLHALMLVVFPWQLTLGPNVYILTLVSSVPMATHSRAKCLHSYSC